MNNDSDIHQQGQSVQDPRAELARSHAALFPATLALARWRSGATPARFSYGDGLATRQQWYARQQQRHQAWLAQGGFSQPEPTCPVLEPGLPMPALACPIPSVALSAADSALPLPADGVRQCGAC